MCQCFLLAVSFNIYMNLPRHKVVGAIVRLNTNSNKLRHSDKASEQVRISPFSLKKIIAFNDVCCNEAVVYLNCRLSKAPLNRQKANLVLKYPKFILAATDSQNF